MEQLYHARYRQPWVSLGQIIWIRIHCSRLFVFFWTRLIATIGDIVNEPRHQSSCCCRWTGSFADKPLFRRSFAFLCAHHCQPAATSRNRADFLSENRFGEIAVYRAILWSTSILSRPSTIATKLAVRQHVVSKMQSPLTHQYSQGGRTLRTPSPEEAYPLIFDLWSIWYSGSDQSIMIFLGIFLASTQFSIILWILDLSHTCIRPYYLRNPT